MPRQNRVTPTGELIAVPDRGLFWGSRGRLHDRDGNLVRHSQGKAWAICVLEFKGRRRKLLQSGSFTELFFLDEATGLAAGHRPCGECRSHDYRAFKSAWSSAHPGQEINAPAIDAHLHRDRLASRDGHRTYQERLDAIPDGTFVIIDGQPWLVWGAQLLAWSPGGYLTRRPRSTASSEVTVQTPRATVATLAAGYRPIVHPSAARTEPRGRAEAEPS